MNKTGLYILGSLIIGGIVYNAIQRNGNPPIFYLKQLDDNYNARTIPPFGIFIKESEKGNNLLLEHELVHWEQYKKLGLVKYYSEYFKQLKQYGYDKMPMEIESRNNESEYVKNNYTESVRNGTAKTVYNPKFRLGQSDFMY